MNRFSFEIKDEEDGKRILKDGESLNCRLMLRDSIGKTDLQIALDATDAIKARDNAILDAAQRMR